MNNKINSIYHLEKKVMKLNSLFLFLFSSATNQFIDFPYRCIHPTLLILHILYSPPDPSLLQSSPPLLNHRKQIKFSIPPILFITRAGARSPPSIFHLHCNPSSRPLFFGNGDRIRNGSRSIRQKWVEYLQGSVTRWILS